MCFGDDRSRVPPNHNNGFRKERGGGGEEESYTLTRATIHELKEQYRTNLITPKLLRQQ